MGSSVSCRIAFYFESCKKIFATFKNKFATFKLFFQSFKLYSMWARHKDGYAGGLQMGVGEQLKGACRRHE